MKLNALTALAVFTVSVASLAACGGGSGPKIKSFAASDTSIPEGGADVTFTWDVKNSSSLELLPYPGAVTGSSATVNVTESTTFTLVAKKSGRSAKKSIDVVVGEAFGVTGNVVNSFYPVAPAIGMTVAIGDQVTITDENGGFHFDDVVAPYDLVVVTDQLALGGSFYYVSVYLGLTVPNPTVSAYAYNFDDDPNRSATISGTVSGGTTTPAADVTNHFFIDLEDEYFASAADGDDPPYSIFLNWASVETSRGFTQHVLQRNSTTNAFAYGVNTGTLDDGQVTTVNPAIASVPARTFDIAVSAPWAYSLYGGANVGIGLQEGFGSASIDYSALLTTADHLVVAVPDVDALDYTIDAYAESDETYMALVHYRPDETALTSVEFPPPLRLLTPVDNAIVGPETKFNIASPAGTVNIFNFQSAFSFGVPGGGAYNANVYVYTDKTEITFPDLPSIGLPLPGGTFFVWSADMIGPWSSLDEAVTSSYSVEWPVADVVLYGETDYRSFETEGTTPGDDDDASTFVMQKTVVGLD